MAQRSMLCVETGAVMSGGRRDEYSEDEIRAVKSARRALLAWGVPESHLDERTLITIVFACKLRADDAIAKYRAYLADLLEANGVDPPDVWRDIAGLDDQWHRVLPAGRDLEGRQVTWVRAAAMTAEEEGRVVRACCRYFVAVHADLDTLRNGVSLVIDAEVRLLREHRAGRGRGRGQGETWERAGEAWERDRALARGPFRIHVSASA